MNGETLGLIALAIALGTASAIMPLGPVTVLVLRRALGRDYGGAFKVGLGRVVAESCYCALAVFGVTALFERIPALRTGFEALGSIVFMALGIWLLVQTPPSTASAAETPDPSQPEDPREARRRRWGNWSGLILAGLNPTLILTWSAGIAIVLTTFGIQPTLLAKLGFPLALACGLTCGYLILIGSLRRWGEKIGDNVIKLILRGLGGAFVLMALLNAARLLGWTT